MKITRTLINATLISASALGFGLAGSAFAQVLVTCGPHNAPRIVNDDAVPLGCRVLQNNYRT